MAKKVNKNDSSTAVKAVDKSVVALEKKVKEQQKAIEQLQNLISQKDEEIRNFQDLARDNHETIVSLEMQLDESQDELVSKLEAFEEILPTFATKSGQYVPLKKIGRINNQIIYFARSMARPKAIDFYQLPTSEQEEILKQHPHLFKSKK